MTTNIATIELQTSVNLASPREAIILTAGLSDLEVEDLRAKNGSIEYLATAGTITPDQSDRRTAIWNLPASLSTGEYTARIDRIVNGKSVATGEAAIYVLPHTNFALAQIDDQVDEGTAIVLQIVDITDPAHPTIPASDIFEPTGITHPFKLHIDWVSDKGTVETVSPIEARWNTAEMSAGPHSVTARLVDRNGQVVTSARGPMTSTAATRIRSSGLSKGDTLKVALQRSSAARTRDQAFWSLIRSCTTAIGGAKYADFIDTVLCPDDGGVIARQSPLVTRLRRATRDLPTFNYGVGAYELLKTATQVFLLLECGGCHAEIKDYDFDEESARLGESVSLEELTQRLKLYLTSLNMLPYIDRVLSTAFRGQKHITFPHCYGVLNSRIQVPCLLELIWSYWHEEGMLVQTMNAVARRFQNIRGPGDRDPLGHLEIDPLRPLNNILWGYIQDELNLLTVKRRAYEYDHHYGMPIYGKAVPTLRPADSRSKFLEGFHNLLHYCFVFYKEDNDTTVIADGFPLLNALKEVHLLLAQGAHNQFGDLPWTARAEMLMQQWLLARPEIRDFLQSRAMVPYKEPWMAQVDTMKTLQGWSDVTVTHFRDLGVYGEQILLTVRYGDWIGINDEDSAKNWARYWRPEIQGYLHAYRAVTGVDLTSPDTVDHTLPAVHLRKRLAMQRAR